MPMFDELSVVSLWPDMQNDEHFMVYFPDKQAKNRLPERDYFFNIMNTLMEEYTQAIMRHANEQRTTGEA
jgi:hypothetical protein